MAQDKPHKVVGSWICVVVIIAAFIAGTVFFIARTWWPLAVSVAVVIAAIATALRVGILQDTRTQRLDHSS